MADHSTSSRKRLRPDEDQADDELERGWASQKRYENTTARDQSRQHNGDHYANVNIYNGSTTATPGSTLPELDLAKDALERLYFDEMDARYLTINASLAPSSCSWLFGRPEYQRWQDVGVVSEHHGFLWVKGKAGAGKSTLMKYLFDKAEKAQLAGHTVVSFFFNARGAPIERSLEGMYRALLHQIFDKLPRLRPLLTKKRAFSAQSQDWSLDRLQSVFRDVVESLDSERLTCYIDALDECTEDEVEDMVSLFEDLGEYSVAQDTQFQVCFASRHYPHISIDRSESLVLEDQDGHKEDISTYIKKKLKISNKVLQKEMSQLIGERASGVFLWVVIVVGILNEACKRGSAQLARIRLEEIPTALTALIKDILQRDKPTKYMVPLLQWILYSKRPLSHEELFLALLSIDSESLKNSHTPEALTRDNIEKFILNTSKGLVEMTKGKTPRVQFIHELVRTHFLGAEGLVKLERTLQVDVVGRSHDQLKRCCYNYLLSEPCAHIILPAGKRLLSGPCAHVILAGLPKAESKEGRILRNQTIAALPFLEYALEGILHHADIAHTQGVAQHEFLSSFPLRSWRILDNTVARFTTHRHCDTVSIAYILAEQGCAALLRLAMERLPEADAPHERCQSLLGAAVDARDVQSVRAILAHKGYEHSLGRAKWLCISLAIENNDFEIVQALVLAKAKPYNIKAGPLSYIWTPKNNALLVAALQPDKFCTSLGHFGLLRQLFSNLSPVALLDGSCVQALESALEAVCKSGDRKIFELLFVKGVRLTRDMLINACGSGNEELVSLLLEITLPEMVLPIAVDVLESAHSAGHKTVVRLLLRNYATSVDRQGTLLANIALMSAIRDGFKNAVSLLLKHGIDTETKEDFTGFTPLNRACRHGHFVMARLLVEHGAAINGRGKTDAKELHRKTSTPLLHAIEGGHSDIARWLIEEGADIFRTSSNGMTALWSACSHGHETIARNLIDRGADVNGRVKFWEDGPPETPLGIAERNCHSAIIRLLKENGAS
jgi:ankyrin repeat protein